MAWLRLPNEQQQSNIYTHTSELTGYVSKLSENQLTGAGHREMCLEFH